MAYELGLISSLSDLSLSNANYGGVRVSYHKESFRDGFAERTENEFDLTRLYEDTDGSFSLKFEGPTASGVLFIVNQYVKILDRAKKYTDKGYRFPLYLRSGNTFRAYLKSASVDMPSNLMMVDTLKTTYNFKVNYIRRGLCGDPITSTPDTTNTNTGFRNNDQAFDFTMPALTNISTPFDLDFKMFNQRQVFPSGILLMTNDRDLLNTMSGWLFTANDGVSNFFPSQVRVFNEDSRGAYSTFDGAFRGVLGYTPTSLNPVTTSGNINIEGILSTNTFTSNKADFYATMRATFSGLRVTVQVIGKQDENITLQTDPIEIVADSNPRVFYLGSFFAQSMLADTRLFIKFTPNVASGTLLMDRFISHGVPDENSRAIQIQGFSKETTVASGNNYLRFISNYFPNLSTAGGIYPTLYARREESGTDRWVESPAYRGNILLFNKEADSDETFPIHTQTANVLRLLYLTTGHAIPASGIKWVHQDANNQKSRIVATALMMSNTNNIFIPPN